MKKHIVLYLSLVVLFFSCKKTEPQVPYTKFATENFMLKSVFKAQIKDLNVRTQKEFFNVDFSEKVSWNLTFRGLTSGALRNFNGLSDGLNESNSYWDGKTNGTVAELNLFLQGEKVVASLEIMGLKTVFTDTINLNVSYNYGLVINDYELSKTPTRYGLFESGIRDVGKDTYDSFLDSVGGTPQGKKYLQINAVDASKDYYVTNFGYNANQNGNPAMFAFTASTPFNRKNPPADSLYINFFIYGYGPSSKTKLGLQISEEDKLWNVYKLGTDTVLYVQNETYVSEFAVNHTGWKLVSIKYSDLMKPSYLVNDARLPNNYTWLLEPSKINSVSFLVQTTDNLGSSFNAKLDYPILTFGKPLLDSNE